MTRNLGGMLLLSAAAVVTLLGRAGAAAPMPPAVNEESPLGRILDFQKKLNEPIDYELLVPTTEEKALDELLTAHDIPWTINESAFLLVQQQPDAIRNQQIDAISKMTRVTRATVLKRLLAKIPNDGGQGTPTYVLRRDHLEITTEAAKTSEARGMRIPAGDDVAAGAIPFPPLAYAAFEDVPLQDALKELARTTESTIVVDARSATEAKAKVTADLAGVSLDAAVQLLADMASLKMVRVANVYYVTSPQNADRLQKEEDRIRQDMNGGPLLPPLSPSIAAFPGLGGLGLFGNNSGQK